MTPALLRAEGLGLRTRRGWVFRDLDLEVRAGELATLTGPAGGGRTSALLALGGRFRTTHGSLTGVGRTAFGLVPGVNEPEPALTVAEHVGERLRLLGRARCWHRAPRGEPDTLVRDLSPLDRHRLMIKLALLEEPDVLLIDDIDVGLTPPETQTLLSELDATGLAVVAVCRTDPRPTTPPAPVLTAAEAGPALDADADAGAVLEADGEFGGDADAEPDAAPAFEADASGRAPSTTECDNKVPFLSSVGVGR